MKILLANWVYNWGSTGYIVRDLRNSYIDKGHEVFIASAVNLGNRVPEAYIFSNKLLLTLYGLLTKYLGFSKFSGSWIATIRFIQYVRRVNPDIVHVHILNNHALNMYYVLKFLGKNRYKTVITHHAEFYYTGCCVGELQMSKLPISERSYRFFIFWISAQSLDENAEIVWLF